MNMIKYPSETDLNKAICDNEPLLALISFDGKTVITSQIDEAVEHHIFIMRDIWGTEKGKMRDMYIKSKARIYVVYKSCGTVGHFPPIYKTYIQIYYNFLLLIKKVLQTRQCAILSHSPTST